MARKPATKPAIDRGLASPGYLDVEDRAADPRGLDPTMALVMASMNKTHVDGEGNKTFLTAEQAKLRLFGIPLPGLAACYAWDCDVLVPGRMLITVGEAGSLKSTLTLEMMRWIAEYGGVNSYTCNELKPPTGVLLAICRNDPALARRILMTQTSSVEEWQQAFKRWVNTANAVSGAGHQGQPGHRLDGPLGLGRRQPHRHRRRQEPREVRQGRPDPDGLLAGGQSPESVLSDRRPPRPGQADLPLRGQPPEVEAGPAHQLDHAPRPWRQLREFP